MLFPIIGPAFLTTFPGVKTRGLNKGKASGCKTSSKYQYNDCHLQGRKTMKSSCRAVMGLLWIPCISKAQMTYWYDINCKILCFSSDTSIILRNNDYQWLQKKSVVNTGVKVTWSSSCKTGKRTKLRRGDPQGLLPGFLWFYCMWRKFAESIMENSSVCIQHGSCSAWSSETWKTSSLGVLRHSR